MYPKAVLRNWKVADFLPWLLHSTRQKFGHPSPANFLYPRDEKIFRTHFLLNSWEAFHYPICYCSNRVWFTGPSLISDIEITIFKMVKPSLDTVPVSSFLIINSFVNYNSRSVICLEEELRPTIAEFLFISNPITWELQYSERWKLGVFMKIQ